MLRTRSFLAATLGGLFVVLPLIIVFGLLAKAVMGERHRVVSRSEFSAPLRRIC
jgi:hypothetical protein